ncbi:MAG: PDZ domain-containing protein [Planctomycetes bacterium]|nr:PDZ domain-containing protein [Planctomycetota bacterium]MCW8134676.1 PDZ domain-containing protein [Planctomycetota bacterium]
MARLRPLIALLLAPLLLSINPQAQSAPDAPVAKFDDLAALQKRIQDVVKKVRPAVVALRMSGSSGSGCFISEDGWVATAGHVSGTNVGSKCTVIAYGGKSYPAEVFGWHEKMDYGLVKADVGTDKVPFCELGESGKVKAGQWLIPMGHPLGPEPGRDGVVRAGRCLAPVNARSMIVIDAPVISGDSGGPVFDLGGKIVAINQSIQTNNVSINNVTPVDLFKELLPKFKNKEGFGNARGPQWGSGMAEPPEGGLTGNEPQRYQQAVQALQGKQYKRSAELFDELLKPAKRPPEVLYNAACAYSLHGTELKGGEAEAMFAKAVATLRRSVEAGWADIDHAEKDPDLDPLRQRKDYQEWLNWARRANAKPLIGLRVRSRGGIRVDDVAPNSPAEGAGFLPDDIIERLGNQKIESANDWVTLVIEKGLTGDEELRISRKGKRVTAKLTVPAFGARVFGQGGAKIVDLTEGGLAFNAGLKMGDIIEQVGEVKISTTLEFANEMLNTPAGAETELLVRRGYGKEKIKFSYGTGDLGGGGGKSGLLSRPDWKQGDNLLKLWDAKLAPMAGAVFPIRQSGKQVAFATAVSADGHLVTKASQIDWDSKFELLDGTTPFEAKLVGRNDRYDVALLKAGRTFSKFIEFKESKTADEFPAIGTLLATLDARGKALAHGFVALPPYDTDKIGGAPDPNSPFLGINARDAAGGGAEVTQVTAGGPAEKGGVKVGDVITAMSGQAVPDWNSLIAMIRGRKSDETITLDVRRGEQTLKLSVTLVPRGAGTGQAPPAKGTGKPELGIQGCRPKDKGVEIGAVKAGSPAELAGITSGEMLLKVDGKEVRQQRDVDAAVSARKIGDSIAVVLQRDGKEVSIDIELAEEDAPPPPPGGGRPNVKGPINDRCTHMGPVIQHDGVVLPNQQGSPVFDHSGRVVGLNIARSDRTRTFALSTARVAAIIAELLKAR